MDRSSLIGFAWMALYSASDIAVTFAGVVVFRVADSLTFQLRDLFSVLALLGVALFLCVRFFPKLRLDFKNAALNG